MKKQIAVLSWFTTLFGPIVRTFLQAQIASSSEICPDWGEPTRTNQAASSNQLNAVRLPDFLVPANPNYGHAENYSYAATRAGLPLSMQVTAAQQPQDEGPLGFTDAGGESGAPEPRLPFRPISDARWLWIMAAVIGVMADLPAGSGSENQETVRSAEVVVVGGTPAGAMAAIAAARSGRSVLLIERSGHLGGMVANGLGATDIATRGATGGLFQDFVRRIRDFYAKTYGPNSRQVADCSDGYHFEPSVGERVIGEMVAEFPGVDVLLWRQFNASPKNVTLDGSRLREIRIFDRKTGLTERVCGLEFIDATYEGDLAAAVGVPFRLGREDRHELDEPMSGQVYWVLGKEASIDSTGLGDNAVQAYNVRLVLTQTASNRVPIGKPSGYRREDYLSLVEEILKGRYIGSPSEAQWAADWSRKRIDGNGLGRVSLMVTLPNGKVDANNNGVSFVSTDLPEENWPWPTSSWAWRDQFALRLREYTLGLLWFCQNDPGLPQDFRTRCKNWGLAADEYRDNSNFPRQVYVREGRRIAGEYLFTAFDALPVTKGNRPPLHADSITSSHYPLDSHAVRKREPGNSHLDGFFSVATSPYTVPYGVIVPLKIDDLLVPVAASATHVGISTLRMEPCWMALGEAAGTAADLSIETGVVPRKIDIKSLQRRLLRHGAVLVYFRDLAPADQHYEAIEMLALRGLLPDWTVRAAEKVTSAEVNCWASAIGIKGTGTTADISRGAFLEQLWLKSLDMVSIPAH